MRTLFVTLSIVIGFIGFIFIVLGGTHPNRVSGGFGRKQNRGPSHTDLYGGNIYDNGRYRYY